MTVACEIVPFVNVNAVLLVGYDLIETWIPSITHNAAQHRDIKTFTYICSYEDTNNILISDNNCLTHMGIHMENVHTNLNDLHG